VYGKNNDYVKLDSYDPVAGEIVSRKFTQLAEVAPGTARSYINEIADKYAPNTKIANTPSVPSALRGQLLQGEMILEIPPQNAPIPQQILDAAAAKNVLIRDSNGRIYP
jgi:filamentous hemagglutinin